MPDQLELIMEKYTELEILCPAHELLAYFCSSEIKFDFSPDIKKNIEFNSRFGAKLILSKYKSFEDYQKEVISIAFGNYLSALEKAIEEGKSKVALN